MSKIAFAALVALAAAGSAQAIVTVSSTNGPDTQPLPAGQSVIYDFESGAPAGLVGNFNIVQGSLAGVYAAPLGDTTHYLAVLGSTGTTTLVLNKSYRSLSFFWGSIDAYNSVTYFTAGGVSLGTFTGANVPGAPDDGSQGNALNNRRVNWDFGADSVKSIAFKSTSNSFELDNIAGAVGNQISPTPEPSTWAMLLTGIGLVGVSMRARRRSRSVVA